MRQESHCQDSVSEAAALEQPSGGRRAAARPRVLPYPHIPLPVSQRSRQSTTVALIPHPAMVMAPLAALVAVLGVLAIIPSSNGEYLAPLVAADCPTKDLGVCCYVLQTCTGTGHDDSGCKSAAEAILETAAPGGINNANVPAADYGCSNGQCLLALNSALYACSAIYDAAACTACEPVFGENLRGVECSVPIGITDGCCYLQGGSDSNVTSNPDAFQGCTTNADCNDALYSNVVTSSCVNGGCFYISSDSICDSSFNPCDQIPAQLLDMEIKETCSALASASPGATIPDPFPAGAPSYLGSNYPGSPSAPGPSTQPAEPPAVPASPPISPPAPPAALPPAPPTVLPTAPPPMITAVPTAKPAAPPPGGVLTHEP